MKSSWISLVAGCAALLLAGGTSSAQAQSLDLPKTWCKLDAPGLWRKAREQARKDGVKDQSLIACPEVETADTLPRALVLPLPCGRSINFVRVDVSVADILDDRLADLGGSAGKTVRSRFTRGKWTEPVSGTFSLAKGGGPANPDLTDLDARVYYIAAYELTELQYDLVQSGLLSEFTTAPPTGAAAEELCKDHKAKAAKTRPNKVLPAANMSWFDALDVARQLNRYLIAEDQRRIAAGLTKPPVLPWEQGSPGFLRLPAEAEWEYAARGGPTVSDEVLGTGSYQIAADTEGGAPVIGSLGKIAVFSKGSSGDQRRGVGGRAPNLLGIYDTIGNVAEFTHDLFQMTRPDRLHGVRGGVVLRGGHTLTPQDLLGVGYRAEEPLFDTSGEVRSTYNGVRLVLVAPVLPGGVNPQARYVAGMRNTEIDAAMELAEKRLTETYASPGADFRRDARALVEQLKAEQDQDLAAANAKFDRLTGLLAASEAALNDAAQRTLEEQVRAGAIGSLAVQSLGRLAFHTALRLNSDREKIGKLPKDDPDLAGLKKTLVRLEKSRMNLEEQTTLQIRHVLSIIRRISESRPGAIENAIRLVRRSAEDQNITKFDRYWPQLDSILRDLRTDPDADLFVTYAPILDDLRERREERFNIDLE